MVKVNWDWCNRTLAESCCMTVETVYLLMSHQQQTENLPILPWLWHSLTFPLLDHHVPPLSTVVLATVFRSSPERWPNKPGKNVRPSIRPSKMHNAATNQLLVFVKVDETFTTIWLSRSSEVRVKVRRWPQSPFGTIFCCLGHSSNLLVDDGWLSGVAGSWMTDLINCSL